jgi:hypothetical protein
MNMNDAKPKGPQDIKIGVRPDTKAKFEEFGARRRMKQVDVADLAIDALMQLGNDELQALMDKHHVDAAEPASAA